MTNNEKIYLKRQVSLFGAVAMIVGGIIGTGIFVSPKVVLEGTQSVGLCLVVWSVCGIVSIAGSLCYAELGTLITKSGGEYAYLLDIYGSYPAFLFCVIRVFCGMPSNWAVASIITATYLAAPVFGHCGTNEIFILSMSCFSVLSIIIISVTSTRLAVTGSELFMLLKLIAAGIIIIGGCIAFTEGKDEGLYRGFSGNTPDPVGIVEACFNAFFAYSGWSNANYITEELKNAQKNLPRAIIISLLIVIMVYVLMNASYIIVLGPEGVLSSDAVAMSFEEKILPTNFLMSISVSLSATGAVLANTVASSRVPYVAARDGCLPECVSFVHVKRNTPVMSILSQAILAFPLIFLGDVTTLINFVSFLEWMFIGMSMFGIIVLRYKRKDAYRPYKVPIFCPVLMVLVALSLVTVPLILKPRLEYLLGIGVLVLATLFYIPFVYFKKSLAGIDTLTVWVQLLFQVAPSEQNEDE